MLEPMLYAALSVGIAVCAAESDKGENMKLLNGLQYPNGSQHTLPVSKVPPST